jgi:hypothetical protein
MRRAIVVVILFLVACTSAVAGGGPTPLPKSFLFGPNGVATSLRAGVVYQANRSFPIPLRITPPDASWSGAQWRTSARGEQSKEAPFFGWADVEQGSPQKGAPPHGALTIMTSFTRTRSAVAIAKYLRTRGHGATYEASTPVRIAGFSGVQFGGTIEGREHAFIPFTAQSRNARFYGDAFFVGKGTVFRIIVLQVRTKAVVIYFDNGALTVDEFPAFVTKAGTILRTLRFPK